jgi:hypothetical protein
MKDYKKMMGVKGEKLMKNHGNTQSINCDAQKYDMGRLQKEKMERKGYSEKAFAYKY